MTSEKPESIGKIAESISWEQLPEGGASRNIQSLSLLDPLIAHSSYYCLGTFIAVLVHSGQNALAFDHPSEFAA